MKQKIKFTFILIIVFTSMCTISLTHSGKTDSNGGHYDSSTGEYHYHHGYSAHQHIDGVCPYEETSNELIIEDNDDELIIEYQQKNEKLQDEIYDLEEEINIYKTKLEDLGFNSIEDLNKELQAKKSETSNLWVVLIFVVPISIYIAYNIGKNKK